MAVETVLDRLDSKARAEFAETFLRAYLEPAFGTLSKREIDVLLFRLLYKQGALRAPSQGGQGEGSEKYEIARTLRITPARVRNLLLESQLRDPSLDDAWFVREIGNQLAKAKFIKDDNLMLIGIESPLLQAAFEDQLKRLDLTIDYSFNREVLRIPVNGLVTFIASALPKDRRDAIDKGLRQAGYQGKGFEKLLRGAFDQLLSKVAGKAAEGVAGEITDQIGPPLKELFHGAVETIKTTWNPFAPEKKP